MSNTLYCDNMFDSVDTFRNELEPSITTKGKAPAPHVALITLLALMSGGSFNDLYQDHNHTESYVLARSPDIQSWVFNFIDSIENINSEKEMIVYFPKLINLISNQDYYSYSFILDNINISKTNEVMIIALLRLSAISKNKIKYWFTFLNKASSELSKRGQNPDSILKGMI